MSAQRKPVIWNNDEFEDKNGVSHHSFFSEAMDREVGYTLYLPENYKDETKRYPVVYFLHGAGGNENADGPAFSQIVARQIEAGELPPVICVFPNGGMSRYRDNPETGINVESMIIKELLPMIDAQYRTLATRDSRAIAGYSMGGGGAIRLALSYPELFSAAGSWAGSFGGRFSAPFSEEFTPERLREIEPQVNLLFIVGYEDEATYQSHAPFLETLTASKYPYTYRTLADVPHKLGLYYQLSGEDMTRFVIGNLKTQ